MASDPSAAPQRYLLTGGAGFIGSRLTRALAADGEARIWVFDNLHPQVHGPEAAPPEFPENVTFIMGDVTDADALADCVSEARPDVTVHLASETGTGQSADEISRYCNVNVMGTAHLVDALRERAPATQRLVLTSSRAVYGEGAYRTAEGAVIVPEMRSCKDMAQGQFTPRGPGGVALTPCPTREDIPPAPSSVYGSTKLMQEHIVQQAARTWSPFILRLQNVYGPGQSLANPYTGVLSIFCAQILQGQRLNIYEDGDIVRDFVFVDDVVAAIMKACRMPAQQSPINIGSGRPVTILEVAKTLLRLLGREENFYDVTGDFRAGDIRHAVADVELAEERLGWTPETSIEEGLAQLTRWARERHAQLAEPNPRGGQGRGG